jgi:hypothetical protein
LNDLYVTLKYDNPELNAVSRLTRYWAKKALRYAIGVYDSYSRDILAGIRIAWQYGRKMRGIPREQLRECYLRCCDEFFGSHHGI